VTVWEEPLEIRRLGSPAGHQHVALGGSLYSLAIGGTS
jgi:hypothetical protein